MTPSAQLPGPEQLAAIRAWGRLDQALSAFERYFRRRHGVTGAQLALLRILADRLATLPSYARGS